MRSRTIAIGDIHGCSVALAQLIEAIQPEPSDVVVPIGDFIDRGPDSRGVLDQLILLRARCAVVPLLGNHEEMLLDARTSTYVLEGWIECGGAATLDSYPLDTLEDLPLDHLNFLLSCQQFHETDTHFFVHANYLEPVPLAEQPGMMLRWESLATRLPGPHVSGKVAVLGHTAQRNGEVLNLGHLVCIDTYCYGGGFLTAFDVTNGQVWQVDRAGKLRA
jgi:serine/threonine protein phosphatase 1